MADPRFYDNRGPFTLAEVCAKIGTAVPEGADGSARIDDVASLTGAGPSQLTHFVGGSAVEDFSQTAAGFCLVPLPGGKNKSVSASATTILIPCTSVKHAFAVVAAMFYPEAGLAVWSQQTPIEPSAEIGERVVLGPGVVIGPRAQIGDGARIGPNTVIGRGVTVGRDCEIGSNVSVSYAYLGDRLLVLPGAQIGQPGFGFSSSAQGHIKIPQLGRVIVQDNVEIGACVTIDRGSLGDTVIGEGTKIDNLVQIGHNDRLGRHCVLVGQVGIAGSVTLGDFVVVGGQAAVGDHSQVGSHTRLAARTGVAPGQVLEGGHDYGGLPAKPVMEWIREVHAVAALIKKRKRTGDE